MKFIYLRWIVRSAMLWIVLGTLFGLLMFVGYRVEALRWSLAWRTAHLHAILVGGVIQMIAGVALWMFPRRSDAPHWPTAPQGWTLWALFNVGTLLRCVVGGPWMSIEHLYPVALAGAAAQTAAILYFLSLVLPRIRGPRIDLQPPR